jgi:hypothetical protein
MNPSFQSLGRGILFVVALLILGYEFIIDPIPPGPDRTIVIAAIGLAAASISLKFDWRA